jgi:trehalose synthase
MVALLSDRDMSERLGQSGRARVREHFLLPRLLLEELALLSSLGSETPGADPLQAGTSAR